MPEQGPNRGLTGSVQIDEKFLYPLSLVKFQFKFWRSTTMVLLWNAMIESSLANLPSP